VRVDRRAGTQPVYRCILHGKIHGIIMAGLIRARTMSQEKKSHRKATITATVLWIVGFALAFVIPKASPYLWLSDALLLLGFWPLLWSYRSRWLWLLFGISNAGIGSILLVAKYLPASSISDRPDIIKIQAHLSDYHFPYVWVLIGLISTLVGIIQLIRALIAWIKTTFLMVDRSTS
jgi:hypothetical protein